MTEQELVKDMYGYAVSVARSYCKIESNVEDYIQEILLSYLNVYKQYNTKVTETELIKLCKDSAKNKCIDLFRRESLVSEYVDTVDEVPDTIGTTDAKSIYSKWLISCCLDKLTDKEKDLFNYLCKGYTQKELKKVMSSRTYHKRVGEIRRKLVGFDG